jgi:hypothetical protein
MRKALWDQTHIQRYCQNQTSEEITETAVQDKRSIQAEGSFAQIKQNMGFRKFLNRGKQNVLTESILLAIDHNINKLHRKVQDERLGQHLFKVKKSASILKLYPQSGDNFNVKRGCCISKIYLLMQQPLIDA